MASRTPSLTDFQAGTMSTYPVCLPVVSAVPAAAVIALRVGQTVKGAAQKGVGKVGTAIHSEDSEKGRKYAELEYKGDTNLKHGAIGAGVAVVQAIPGGAMVVRQGVKVISAGLKD